MCRQLTMIYNRVAGLYALKKILNGYRLSLMEKKKKIKKKDCSFLGQSYPTPSPTIQNLTLQHRNGYFTSLFIFLVWLTRLR